MNRGPLIWRLLVPAATAVVLGLAAVACGAKAAVEPTGDAGALTRVDGAQGGVTVEATWITGEHLRTLPEDLLGGQTLDRAALVHVKVDTHSVDLSGYDLASQSRLRGGEEAAVPAAAWLGISESSHHREGVLVFPVGDAASWARREGRAVLSLNGLAGVAERSLAWEF